MARGVFSGLIWGGIVAVAGAGGLSLAFPDFKPAGAVQAPAEEQPAAEPEAQEPAETVSREPQAPSENATETPAAPEQDTAEIENSAAEEATEVGSAEDFVEVDLVDQPAQPEDTAEAQDTAEQDTTLEAAELGDDAGEGEAMQEPEPEVAPVVEPEPESEEIAALPQTDGEGTVGNLAPNVTTDRLPSVGTEEQGEDGPSARAPAPIERFAADYSADEGKPLMSIVLMDEGDAALGVEALEAFPYPLTFAVNASLPDAAERMQIYRDKGFEVLAIVDLPRGATPADVEVAMTGFATAVPEAVGFLEGLETGVQTGRDVTDQITQIVLESGHGFLFQPSGLNTARKLAEREGVPSATVFRDFDGSGQSAAVMRRFLDQAAFRAGQEGGVIMLGRLQGETISALLIWGLADRASRVSLVPVSAVLTQK